MNPKLIIALLLLLILLGLAYMWPVKKMQPTSSTPKIVETKTFSCPGMEEFTFEYPVFEGWEMDVPRMGMGDDKICYAAIVNPHGMGQEEGPQGGEMALTMTVRQSVANGTLALEIKNQHNVAYNHLRDTRYSAEKVIFSLGAIGVSVVEVEVYGGMDFPKDQFYQTVINSFRVVK